MATTSWLFVIFDTDGEVRNMWSVRESSPRIWTCYLAKFWEAVLRSGGAAPSILSRC
jgi:hypothetical protein